MFWDGFQWVPRADTGCVCRIFGLRLDRLALEDGPVSYMHIRLSKLLHAFHLLGCVVESATIQASQTTSMHPARIVVYIWVLTSEVKRKSSRLKHFVPASWSLLAEAIFRTTWVSQRCGARKQSQV